MSKLQCGSPPTMLSDIISSAITDICKDINYENIHIDWARSICQRFVVLIVLSVGEWISTLTMALHDLIAILKVY